MLARKYQNIHDRVKKKIALGTSNAPDAAAELASQTELLRQIRHKIFFDENGLIRYFENIKLKDNQNEIHVFDIFLTALLTEVFQTARCGEHTAVGIAEHLKHGINKSIEEISIEGNDINGNPGQHVLIVLDRNSQSDIKNPNTWCNVILFDTWWLATSREFSGSNHPSKKDLCFVIPQVLEIASDFRLDRNLTAEEWHHLAIFFKNIDRHLFNTTQYKTFLKNLGCNDETVKSHIALLQKTLAEHIEEFSRLAFTIKHWEKPPVYSQKDFMLFKTNPRTTIEPAANAGPSSYTP